MSFKKFTIQEIKKAIKHASKGQGIVFTAFDSSIGSYNRLKIKAFYSYLQTINKQIAKNRKSESNAARNG